MKKNKNKNKEIQVSRDIWISILSMSSDPKYKYNKKLNCDFVSEERIKSKIHENFWRLTVRDIKTNTLYCIKYIRFVNDQGKPDIDVNNEYFCKIYKI